MDNNGNRIAQLINETDSEGNLTDAYLIYLSNSERMANVIYDDSGNYELQFINGYNENYLYKETITYTTESSITYEITTTKQDKGVYTIQISIPFTEASTLFPNNDYTAKLVANNITESTSNYGTTIPKVEFTEDSLKSYSGNEVIFNAANFGPTETESSTEMYFGPSSITFDVGIGDISNINKEGVITLNTSSSKDSFIATDLENNVDNANDKQHSLSIGVDDTTQEFGSFTDYYEFELTIPFIFNNQKDETLTADDFASSNGNIIISDNIYIQDMSTTINGLNTDTMEVRGYNYLITQKLSLGTFYYAVRVGTTGYLQDLVFAISADADPNDERASVNVFDVVSNKTGGTRVSNVLIYGTIRQISVDKFLNSGTNAGSITVLNALSSNAISMESNMSLIGADGLSGNSVWQNGDGFSAGNGESVLTTLSSKTEGTTLNDNSILVAGNGGNGSNGADGERSTQINSPNGEDGSSGGDGGNGGSVSGGTISISGADGTAGNGGNGADGLNASKTTSGTYSKRSNNLYNYSSDENRDNGVAGGGGAGGDSGETQANNTMTNRQYNNDIAGSGGSGGLGMYYSGVENYETEFYHKYSYSGSNTGNGGGYNDTGYNSSLSTDSSNNYQSWIKTSGGGGLAGDDVDGYVSGNVKSGMKGSFVTPNTNILRRGFNRFRDNTTATSGYYWNYDGRERLFGNLQMTSTFSYYGTTPDDTGPIDYGKTDRYINFDDISKYFANESGSGWDIDIAQTVIAAALLGAAAAYLLPFVGNVVALIYLGVAAAGEIAKGVGILCIRGDNTHKLFGGHIGVFNWVVAENYIPNYTSGTVFGQGNDYYADGGFGDYWWLYDSMNHFISNPNLSNNYERAFRQFLDGLNKRSNRASYNYYKNNSSEQYAWENNFYGGLGAGDGTGINGNGGTAYTKEIYGYARADQGQLDLDNWTVSDETNGYKCFFTRNDMVTSSGKYGDAGLLTKDSDETSGLKPLGNFVDETTND